MYFYVAQYWGGWTDQESEGTFQNINTGEKLEKHSFQPWNFGEPNGGRIENCQSAWADQGTRNDLDCSTKVPFFCTLLAAPYFTLRGELS